MVSLISNLLARRKGGTPLYGLCRTPSKLKCGIPIWENSEEYWYLLLKMFVFPKVLAKWKKERKCSVEFS